ncbi:MAG: tripartite tricarboxylate transporter TctB family protein [Firmicutes bacterium]|nr:tripartite tricarboxylate transporter TctB family protein [Bacillota bacterium]
MENVGNKEDVRKLRKADLVTSVFLFIFGLLFLIGALKMPVAEFVRYTGTRAGMYTAPGIFPAFVGIIIMLEAVLLFRVGLLESGGIIREDLRGAAAYFRGKEFQRLIIALALIVLYIFGMLGRIRYEVATFIFLFATMAIFRDRKTSLVKIAIISVLVAVAVGYGFSKFARIPLP